MLLLCNVCVLVFRVRVVVCSSFCLLVRVWISSVLFMVIILGLGLEVWVVVGWYIVLL